MILGAWITLALLGRWRPNPTWADRAGCVLGLVLPADLPLRGTLLRRQVVLSLVERVIQYRRFGPSVGQPGGLAA